MPSKKKKYNSRFPPARIKKIMQTDEEIGKVAAAVPVLISKCLEMFLASLLTNAGAVTKSKRAKTMSRSHLKECIMTETMFDFLKDHVANIPDVQNDDEASGSSSFPMEKDPAKKVVRKRSLSKVKKTPKKRRKLGHSNNNGTDDETDSADDMSENGSGNEESDNMLSSSFSSPGLLSPTIQSKLEMQSASTSLQNQGELENAASERKPSIHIPLDVLLSSEEIPSSVNITKPVVKEVPTELQATGDEAELPSTSYKTEDTIMDSKDKENSKECASNVKDHVNTASVRQGVIVKNTVAYPPSVSSKSNSQNPPDKEEKLPQTQSTNSCESKNIKTTKDTQLRTTINNTTATEEFKKLPVNSVSQNDQLPPQSGSMLSFLYSPVPMTIPHIPVPPTAAPLAPTVSHNEKYAYSPLTQHRLMEPTTGAGQPSLYPGLSSSLTKVQGPPFQQKPPDIPKTVSGQEQAFQSSSSADFPAIPPGYPYPYLPYNPNVTQRHYLGYPQSMLTPPSHHLAGVNPHLATHPSLHQAKPKSRTKSDDDDYDA